MLGEIDARSDRVAVYSLGMLNPRHLRAFVTVARTGSVARSAGSMHRVQSAITRAVKTLEQELNVDLFERRPHGMLLTAAGKLLHARAEHVFAEMTQARIALQALADPIRISANAPIFALGIGRQRLLVFVELMKQCHMGVVADTFHISQPAVSLALREMESSLGIPLVTRTPSGIAPNAAGTLLSTHLRRVLSEIATAEQEILSLRQGITGHVTVGTLSLGRIRLLPQAILQITHAHPNITVSTIEGSFEHLSSLLRAGDIDVILGGLRLSEPMPELETQAIVSSHIALITRRAHPVTQLPADARWPYLAQAAWILPQPGTWTRSFVEASFAGQALPAPRVVVESADVTVTRGLLLHSDMVTAASPYLFQHELETGELVACDHSLPFEARAIGIIRRANRPNSVAAQLLIDALQTVQTLQWPGGHWDRLR